MAHRAKRYAVQAKEDKVQALAFDKSPSARKARLETVTHGQWKKRTPTNYKGFWKPENN